MKTILGIIGVIVCLALSSCDKKKDSKVASAGGGVSTQSVVTLQGAAQ